MSKNTFKSVLPCALFLAAASAQALTIYNNTITERVRRSTSLANRFRPGQLHRLGIALAWSATMGMTPGPTQAKEHAGSAIAPRTIDDRAWITESEFDADISLHAAIDQTIVLDLENSSPSYAGRGNPRFVRNVHRFVVERTDIQSFCVSDDEQIIRKIEIRQTSLADPASRADRRRNNKGRKPKATNGGKLVYSHKANEPCNTVTLQPGTYEVTVTHDSRQVGGAPIKAFFHLSERSKTFGTDPFGDDPIAFGRPEFMAFKGPNDGIVSDALSTLPPLPLISGGDEVDLGAVFRLGWGQFRRGTPFLTLTDGNSKPIIYQTLNTNPRCGVDRRLFLERIDPNQACTFGTAPLTPNDHGNGQFDFWNKTIGGPINLSAVNELFIQQIGRVPGQTMTLLYKGFNCTSAPCTAENLTLQEGEVAFFGQCNFKGPAVVFSADTPDLRIFDAPAKTDPILGVNPATALSVRVGPNTLMPIYQQPNYAGDPIQVGADTPCLSDVAVDTVASFKIINRDNYIASSKGCAQCVLNGVNFDGENFAGYNFVETLLSGASLQGTNFQSANLNKAVLQTITVDATTNFTSSNLSCTSFTGADLTGAQFGSNQFATDGSCVTNLEKATVEYSQFDTSLWRYLDLSSSTMSNVPEMLSSKEKPLDISGAVLSHVTWLQGIQLDSVNLGCYPSQPGQTGVCPTENGTAQCSRLNGIELTRTSLVGACLQEANLQGAELSFSNLDGSNMQRVQMFAEAGGSPATLRGAFMRNVKLDGSNLSGVLATNANFYSTGASAQNLVAPNINFANAYLAGADFTGSDTNLKESVWTNAVLVGTKFGQADLSGDPNNRTVTSFEGAYMQGTGFSGSQALDTANADFSDSYWDLTNGKTIRFLLPTSNLEFVGYWKAGTCAAEPDRLCGRSSDCGQNDTCQFPLVESTSSPAAVCETAGTICSDDSVCGPNDSCIAAPECVGTFYMVGTTTPTTTSSNTCPDTNSGPCDGKWEDPLTPISEALPRSAFSPDFPTSPGAAQQCEGEDFLW